MLIPFVEGAEMGNFEAKKRKWENKQNIRNPVGWIRFTNGMR